MLALRIHAPLKSDSRTRDIARNVEAITFRRPALPAHDDAGARQAGNRRSVKPKLAQQHRRIGGGELQLAVDTRAIGRYGANNARAARAAVNFEAAQRKAARIWRGLRLKFHARRRQSGGAL